MPGKFIYLILQKDRVSAFSVSGKNSKAPGYDGIDNIVVKVIFNSFPPLLLNVFNKCLELKCFPDPLKIGLVILFHKTGKGEQNIKSYRPISLLPTLGKLLEKFLLQGFNFQLKTKKLQHPLQYGFREGKSADDALLHVTSLLGQDRRQETHDNCSCGEKGDPMHYVTKCRFTLSWHFQTPTVSLKLQWLKNILTNNSSRTRLRLLMRFICDEDNIIVEDNH
ncbi:hypothetical protein AVEN_18277-1 [Araneus ventricosus]|uniref:Reverse transcriptase domain-containing protein n=1 Tax=Araneus ventricosus TaxID=182803 RepID=A0A4Y2AJ46_ARAVE|nr:hypothetical protein AVEN_18277-1 [Araneus ventricosus]